MNIITGNWQEQLEFTFEPFFTCRLLVHRWQNTWLLREVVLGLTRDFSLFMGKTIYGLKILKVYSPESGTETKHQILNICTLLGLKIETREKL